MAVTFGCICAAVAVGTLIRRRLHEHHLTSPTQEVVKVSAGIVATLTALVLGLLVGGSKQFYDSKVAELRTFVVNISLLDRSMGHYEPSLMAERQLLGEFTKIMLGGLWGTDPTAARTDLLAPLDRVRDALRVWHYSMRTEECYVSWITRYILFHNKRHPAEMSGREIEEFLTDLAVRGHVSASTPILKKAGAEGRRQSRKEHDHV